ncbi:nitrate- and nitrite sensing domain-containing protein [Embleya sp. NBC_00888]|uniref:sensor histidine kinase n=1 Tax=Embleya sp. NBC_00888 TaxID=2975960 RepID=UPI00386CF9B0|nr:nitrate- and nitrite sensing domain-containing protein [Embleya sp. NBC_00888]
MRKLMRVPGTGRTRAGRSRSRRTPSIRTLLVMLTVVPSVAMVALWGIATYRLADHASGLDHQVSVAERAGTPAYNTMVGLQLERRLTAAWMAKPSPATTEALRAQRAKTDEAVRTFVAFANSDSAETPGNVMYRAGRVAPELAELPDVRRQVDATGATGRDRWLGYYTKQVANQISIVQALAETSDVGVTFEGQFLVIQFRAGEAMAQEDMTVSFAQPGGRLTQPDFAGFVQNVGVRRHTLEDEIEPFLPDRLRPLYMALTESPAWRELAAMENAIIAAVDAPRDQRGTASGIALPAELTKWRETFDQLALPNSAFDFARVDLVFEAGDEATEDTWNQVYLLSAIGLGFVLIGALLCWRVTRAVRRRLSRLRDATVELGSHRLPVVIERLQRGERVDLAVEAPDVPASGDEIGQVASAFNAAQRAALDGAVQLARQREGFAKVFVNTALRTQSLVNRQIGELDAMERRHQDPELLRELFTIDHLATRLRRYEENLVVLTGNRPGRRWSRPVRIVDVVRGAVGEVEDYHRVEVYSDRDLQLSGPAVGGVIHLLAELVENAAMFSPPDTPVHVRAVSVAKGLAIEIEDRGLGMSADEYAAANRQLAVPVSFDVIALAEDVRMGLFVVAQLADRLGVDVTLRPSPYGGTLAIVFLPEELISRESGTPGDQPGAAGPFEHALAATPDSEPTGEPAAEAESDESSESVHEPEDEDVSRTRPPARQHPDPVVRSLERVPAAPAAEAEPTPASATAGPAAEETTADGRRALPRRVRQRNLPMPLRGESGIASEPDPRTGSKPSSPREAAATLSSFRFASQRAREASEPNAAGDESAIETEPGTGTEPAPGPHPVAGSTTHPGEPS